MNLDQAITIVRQACASVMGNLETHQQIQVALGVVVAAAKEKTEPAKKPAKSKPSSPQVI